MLDVSYVTPWPTGHRDPLEEDMFTAYEVLAREIGASRRAEAEEAALSTAVRLAARERRLQRRLDRVHGRLSGQNISA